MSPTFLLDGNIGYARMAPSTYPIQYGQNVGLDVLKLPGTNGPDIFESGIPEFRISGYETIGNPGSATPYFWHDNQFQYNANATWMKGKHNIRFGLDISRQHMNHLTAEQGAGPRGSFQYTGGATALRGGAAPNQFNAFADFHAGLAFDCRQDCTCGIPGFNAVMGGGLLFPRSVAGNPEHDD